MYGMQYCELAVMYHVLCGMLQVATTLTALTKLVLADTPGLSLSSVRGFPSLRFLDLCRCESVAPGALQSAVESCGRLQTLLLDGCHLLPSLKLTAPHLQVRGFDAAWASCCCCGMLWRRGQGAACMLCGCFRCSRAAVWSHTHVACWTTMCRVTARPPLVCSRTVPAARWWHRFPSHSCAAAQRSCAGFHSHACAHAQRLPWLQEISLRGCVALGDLELNCWRLATLRLGPILSWSPGNSSLQRLALYSGALRRMDWVQCRWAALRAYGEAVAHCAGASSVAACHWAAGCLVQLVMCKKC